MLLPTKCDSPACRSDLRNFRRTFYVDSLKAPCPNCAMEGYLSPCADIHLLVKSRYGPIISQGDPLRFGQPQRYDFLCSTARQGFLLPTNHPLYPRHYTTVVSACTCTQCLLEYGGREVSGEILLLK